MKNASYIKEKYGCKLVVHRTERAFIEKGMSPDVKGSIWLTKKIEKLINQGLNKVGQYKAVETDVRVEEVFDLSELGFNGYILHTPGHSKGSISIILDKEIALVGDAMFGVFGESIYPPYIVDIQEMVKSWGKLLDTGCSLFLPGHGKAIKRPCVIRQYNKYY